MNYKDLLRGGALLLAAITVGCMPKINRTIDPAARVAQGGRELKVTVIQSEIKADIQVSQGGAAFGLIGALIDSGVNKSRATDAEKTVQVVRESLNGFDFDGLAMKQTRQTLEKIEWFGLKGSDFGKEFTDTKRLEWLDASKSPQVMCTDFDYAMTSDFGGVRVSMVASLANKDIPGGGRPEDRLSAGNLPYLQQFIVVLPLSNPSKDVSENAKRWAAEGGKLTRSALEKGLEEIQHIFERSLTQTPEAYTALETKEMTSAGGYSGRLIDKTEEGTLMRLIDGRWVFVSAKTL